MDNIGVVMDDLGESIDCERAVAMSVVSVIATINFILNDYTKCVGVISFSSLFSNY
jgi:hypothetical protein